MAAVGMSQSGLAGRPASGYGGAEHAPAISAVVCTEVASKVCVAVKVALVGAGGDGGSISPRRGRRLLLGWLCGAGEVVAEGREHDIHK